LGVDRLCRLRHIRLGDGGGGQMGCGVGAIALAVTSSGVRSEPMRLQGTVR
jgi:hypothetical protein